MKNEAFQIRVADHRIEITSCYPQIRLLCEEYLCEKGAPEYSIRVTEQEIRREQPEGVPDFSAGYLETLAIYRKLADWMMDQDTVLLHGSAVSVHGRAYLFTAPSGTGKSTHTSLWRDIFGNAAVMINDDKPLLKIEKHQVTVYGTPWNGKHRLGNNISAPLQGICILRQGRENSIQPVKKKEAFQTLFNQIYRPFEDSGKMLRLLALMDDLLEIPVWKMDCTISREAAVLAYETMRGD